MHCVSGQIPGSYLFRLRKVVHSALEKTVPSRALFINGAYVSSCRDHGIIVTSDLTLSVHINDIVFKAHKRANAMHRCFTSRNTELS